MESGEWQSTESHVSGMIDSYYEYLLKAWLLFGDEDFLNMWETSIAAVNLQLIRLEFPELETELHLVIATAAARQEVVPVEVGNEARSLGIVT